MNGVVKPSHGGVGTIVVPHQHPKQIKVGNLNRLKNPLCVVANVFILKHIINMPNTVLY